MAAKKKEKQTARENIRPADDSAGELRAPVWSVISFDKCEASNLTYAQAEEKINSLERQKVSGLCIVTDEVASRL